MSKEVLIVDWCDGEHETRTHADESHTISLDGARPIALDLCNEHMKVLEPLIEMLELGTPVAEQPASTRQLKPRAPYGSKTGQPARGGQAHPMVPSPCEFPGCDRGPGGGPFIAQSRTGLGAHMVRTHKIKLPEFELAKRSERSEEMRPGTTTPTPDSESVVN